MPLLSKLEKKLGRLFEPTKGAPDVVWFSRDVQQGLLRRWMIVVQSVRIMLIRRPDGVYDLVTDAVWNWTPQGECVRLAEQGRVVLNHYDRHVLCPIGETHLSSQDVSQRFDGIQTAYPPQLSWTQCQVFLRQFVTAIVDRPGWEWQWYLDNTDTASQVLFQLPPPPAHLVMNAVPQYGPLQHQSPNQNQHSVESSLWASRMAMQHGVAYQIQQQNQQNQTH